MSTAQSSTRPLRIAVLIPARDEAECLPVVLDALSGAGADRVLVVDNGSSDRTVEVARHLGAGVVSESRVGYGSACQRGIATLAEAAATPEVVVFLDADDAAAPAQLEVLVEPIRAGEADLVLGRRLRGGVGRVPNHAHLGNRLISAALRWLYGSDTRDLGPFRAIRFDVLRLLRLDDPDFGWNVQMQVRALRGGYRVTEVPVRWARRAAGRSKVSGSLRGSVRAGWRMTMTLLRETARRSGNGG
jgi:glycosyltransferase involved in cell wall biosynthesis